MDNKKYDITWQNIPRKTKKLTERERMQFIKDWAKYNAQKKKTGYGTALLKYSPYALA